MIIISAPPRNSDRKIELRWMKERWDRSAGIRTVYNRGRDFAKQVSTEATLSCPVIAHESNFGLPKKSLGVDRLITSDASLRDRSPPSIYCQRTYEQGRSRERPAEVRTYELCFNDGGDLLLQQWFHAGLSTSNVGLRSAQEERAVHTVGRSLQELEEIIFHVYTRVL